MFLRSLLIFALALCVSLSSAEGAAKGKKKKKSKGGLRAMVVSVQKKDGETSLRVKPMPPKKGGTVSPGQLEEKTITVGKTTKIELVSGKKGSRETKAGSIDDLKQGERVLVRGGESGAADTIMIRQGKKKKSS